MKLALSIAVVILAAVLLPADETDVVNLLREGKKEEAIALLRKEIAARPEAVQPNVLLVEVLLHAERFDEADDAIKAALAASAQAPDLHRVHGDLLFREGHILEADAEYKAAFHADKKNARALNGIARTFRVAGLRGKAVGLVRAAHELDPDDEVINSSFYSLDNSIARWEKVLQNPAVIGDPEKKRHAEMELEEAKLLNGGHAFELASPYRHYQLPYRVLYDGKRPTGIGMTIVVNGVKSELRVDTGAGGVTVSSGFAAKAGIRRIGAAKMFGIGSQGDVDIWIGYAERMQIGDIEFKNIFVKVREKGSVDDSGGLLGTDIFERFLVKLNFYAGRIDLDPLPGPSWDGYTPVDRYDGPEVKDFAPIFQVSHFLLIPTLVSEKQKSEQTNCLFMVDTGAGLNNISTSLAPSVTKLHNNDYATVRGVSGKVKMLYQADRVVLQFASFRQTNLDLISLDLSRNSEHLGIEVSGTLGLPVLSMFQSVTIDYRDARINFDYKPR